MQRGKLLAEGAGATPLAALLAGKINDIEGKNVVAMVSGGNIDITTVGKIIDKEVAKSTEYELCG